MATRLKPANTETVADVRFQAEVLRGQLCDDINRRFWRARHRLLRAFSDRKDQVRRDHDKLPADAFLAKYAGWRFR